MIAAASGTGTKRVTVGLIPCTVPDQSTASPWHCHGSAGTLGVAVTRLGSAAHVERKARKGRGHE